MSTRRRLGLFTGVGYDKGRGIGWQIAWQFASSVLVMPWFVPVRVRIAVLRFSGPWSALTDGVARLVTFRVPRG